MSYLFITLDIRTFKLFPVVLVHFDLKKVQICFKANFRKKVFQNKACICKDSDVCLQG